MNTKGIKFLAVLAVLAMAFAVFAVVAPAENNDAAVTYSGNLSEEYTTNPSGASVYLFVPVELTAATFNIANDSTGTIYIDIPQNHPGIELTITNLGTSNVIPLHVRATTNTSSTGTADPLGTLDMILTTANSGITISAGANTAAASAYLAMDKIPAGTKVYGVDYFEKTANKHYYYDKTAVISSGLILNEANDQVVLIKGTVTVEQKAVSKEGQYSLAGKVTVVDSDDTNGYTTTFDYVSTGTSTDKNYMTVTPSNVGNTLASVTMVSGGIKFLTNTVTITAFTGLSATNTPGTADKLLYGPGYEGSDVTDVWGAFGTGNKITAASVTAHAATGTLSITAASTTSTLKITGMSGTIAGGTTTTITDSSGDTVENTIELVSGTFTGITGLTKKNLIIDESATLVLGSTVETFTLSKNSAASNIALTVMGTLTTDRTAGTNIAGTTLNNELIYIAATASIGSNITVNDTALVLSDYTTSDYGIKGELSADTTVTDAYLADDLTIPEGMTLTVNGMLYMGTHDLKVNGTLKIASLGSIGSIATTAKGIVLGATGKIENQGSIGKNVTVTVKHASNTNSVVTTIGANGLEFGSAKVSGTYYLTVAGTVVKASSVIPTNNTSTTAATYHMITTSNVKVSGDMIITSGLTFACTGTEVSSGKVFTLGAGATLGTVSTNKLTLLNKSQAVINGTFFGTIAAKTHDALRADGTSVTPSETLFISADYNGTTATTTYTEGSVSGFTINVAQVEYTANDIAYLSQRAYISGTLGITESTNKRIVIAGADANATPAFVADDTTLSSDGKALIYVDTASNGQLIAHGLVSSKGADVANVVGSHFSVTDVVTGTFYYITDFGTAFAAIESAVGKMITVTGFTGTNVANGDALYTIDDELEILSGYSIQQSGGATFIIGEDAVVTVESGAAFAANTITTIANNGGINGKLVVKNGGSCNPTVAQYQVLLTSTSGDRTYASLAVILGDAEDGDTITLVGASSNEDALVIDKAITLNVANTLQVYNFTIGEGAKVVLTSNGTLNMDCTDKIASQLTVAGELNVTAGTFTMADNGTKDGTIISTGKMTFTSGQKTALDGEDVEYYGALYTSSGNYVLTTAKKALEDSTAVTIVDDYYTDDAVVLKKGATLTIDGNAKVYIASIDLSNGVKDNVATVTVTTGELTATLVGKSGIDGADAVSVYVEKFLGGFKQLTTVDTKNVSTSVFEPSKNATKGSITLIDGTVTSEAYTLKATDGEGSVFTVGEDAILFLKYDPSFQNYSSVIIAGSITTDADDAKDLTTACDTYITGAVLCNKITANTAGKILDLDGTLACLGAGSSIGGSAASVFYMDGTLLVDENDSFTINYGPMIVGTSELSDEPVIDAVITLTNNAYILSYGEPIPSENLYSVNYVESVLCLGDDVYAYDYTTANCAIKLTALLTNKAIKFVAPGYNLDNVRKVASWTDEDGDALNDDTTIKGVDAYFALVAQNVKIKTSWATGLSLFVDGARMVGTEYTIDIGAHTVNAQVNPGYACDNMSITFDGVVVPITASGAMIILDLDDAGSVLAVSGDVYVPEPEPVTPEEKSEWTITTILLVVLVILIAIMAVIVALRLNRS